MNSLQNAQDLESVMSRLAALRAEQAPLWGSMSAHRMMCHVNDSYLAGMGEKQVSPASGWFQRTVMKFGALRIPREWPKGVATRPEVMQGMGGTPPGVFEEDRRKLVATIRRFSAAQRDFEWSPHPLFGVMSDWEWLRWGYLHADHHLRQFGR